MSPSVAIDLRFRHARCAGPVGRRDADGPGACWQNECEWTLAGGRRPAVRAETRRRPRHPHDPPEDWRPFGPPFFLAGLAVTLASVPALRRREYLDLAEALHPGATEPQVFAKWLAETPLPPSRLLPMLEAGFLSAA